MTDQPDKPVVDAERKHTPLTNEILKVIDQQPLNRYEVALRLTRWAEAREQDAERRTLLSLVFPSYHCSIVSLSNDITINRRRDKLGKVRITLTISVEAEDRLRQLTQPNQPNTTAVESTEDKENEA